MSEDTEALKETLARLKHELESTPSLDASTSEELRAVLDEITGLLARSGPAEQAAAPLAGRLTDSAYRLEAAHPRLALALHEISEALSNMGI